MSGRKHTDIPKIEDYKPLDPAGNTFWMPVPHACSSTLDMSYDVQTALVAWGVIPVCDKPFTQIMHPDDPKVGKFTLPKGWSVPYRGRFEWSLRDENDRERVRIYYESGPYDYIVQSHLRIPFDLQTRISRGKVPPRKWWMELSHHGRTVFKSDVIRPFPKKVRKLQKQMGEVEFSMKVFFPRMGILRPPLEEAAKAFLKENYPDFPVDPNAYW